MNITGSVKYTGHVKKRVKKVQMYGTVLYKMPLCFLHCCFSLGLRTQDPSCNRLIVSFGNIFDAEVPHIILLSKSFLFSAGCVYFFPLIPPGMVVLFSVIMFLQTMLYYLNIYTIFSNLKLMASCRIVSFDHFCWACKISRNSGQMWSLLPLPFYQ